MSDRAQFVRAVVQALRNAGEAGKIAVDAADFALVLPGDRRLQLASAFADWSAAGAAARDQIARRFATAMARMQPIPDDELRFRAGLLLQVRSADDIAGLQAQVARHGSEFTSEAYGPELALIPVYDQPESLMMLSEPDLRKHGLGAGEALKIARANLRQRSAGGFRALRPGVFASSWGDSYDAARLVLTEMIARLDVRGDPVALVPRRETLLITGSDDDAGLAMIAALAEPELANPRSITGHALRWRAGEWTRFLPPPSAPAFIALQRMSMASDAQVASEQKTQLAAEQARAGVDLHIAELCLASHKASGAASTFCIWSEGPPRLLPCAKLVVFARNKGGELDRIATVAWADAIRIVGHRMIAQGVRPERWRVDGLPSAAELAQLAAADAPMFG
jgi:hypothetical protein